MSVNTSLLQLNGSTASFLQLQCPASGAGNTLTLPVGNGTAGQQLTTDGNGVLSWQDAAPDQQATPINTILSNSFDLSEGPFWKVTTSFIIPNPTNIVVASSGLIKFEATPTGFASYYELGGCGTIFAGDVCSFWVVATNKVLIGNPTGDYT
jgi:hypothetical protein